jgi:3-mercaptopyruvate sulfurtransferase SseA
MHTKLALLLVTIALLGGGAAGADPDQAEHKPAASIPTANLIQPADLATLLSGPGAASMTVLQVGSKTLYAQGHIPGAQYAGPGGEDEGLDRLRARVATLSKDSSIVLYCGCCPWSKCPNIAAAFDTMQSLGFTHVKVLYIARDFGANWADMGYPVAKGQ